MNQRDVMLKIKRPLMRLACHPLVGRTVARLCGDRIRNRGCLINTSDDSVHPSIKASLFWGSYEKSEVLFVQRYVDDRFDVIELGSSLGVVASHVAKRLSTARKLVCVEANPNLLDNIRLNVQLNAADVSLEVVHAAIHYGNASEVTLALAERNVDSQLAAVDHVSTGHTQVNVPAVTLGKLWSRIDRSPFVLVSDIEGAEFGIIQHEAEALQSCRTLLIELHAVQDGSSCITPDELSRRLQNQHGFQLIDRRGDVFAFIR